MPAVDDGYRFGIHFLTAGERIMENRSSCGLKFILCYFIDLHVGSIHRYHAVGGANGTTMVVMFVGLMC